MVSSRKKKIKIPSLISFTIIFLNPSKTFSWTYLEGGDHLGQDWYITANTTVAGVHTNIGTFTIDSGITLTIQGYNGTTYGQFEVQAEEKHLWQEVMILGIKCEAADVLKEVHHEVFKAYGEQSKAADGFKRFITKRVYD